jgi:hypothetical protein
MAEFDSVIFFIFSKVVCRSLSTNIQDSTEPLSQSLRAKFLRAMGEFRVARSQRQPPIRHFRFLPENALFYIVDKVVFS